MHTDVEDRPTAVGLVHGDAADAGRQEDPVVRVDERSPGRVLAHHRAVERCVRRASLRARQERRGRHLAVVLRDVEVRVVVVLRVRDLRPVEQDVHEVVGVGVVRAPPLDRHVERRRLRVAGVRELLRPREQADLGVEADLLQVVLDELRLKRCDPRVRRPQHGLAAAEVALGELPGLLVRVPGEPERVDALRLVAEHPGREDLPGPLAVEVAALGGERLAVDGPVDGLREPRVVLEQRPRVVHRDVADVQQRTNLHPAVLLVQPVLGDDVLPLGRRDAGRRVVGRAPLDVLVLHRDVVADVDLDRVDVRRAAALVVRVALERDRATRSPAREVVRAARRVLVDPVRVDLAGEVGVDRLHERHRQAGEEVRRRLGQAHDELVALGADARDRAGLAVDRRPGRPARCRGTATPVDCIRGFANRLKESTKLRARDGLAVREPEARLDRERVRLAVPRDTGRPSRHFRRRHGTGRAFLVRPVHQLAGGRRLHLPRLAVVRELRVDVVHIGRDLERERAAALRGRRGGRRRCDEQGDARDREDDPEQSFAEHVAPFSRISRTVGERGHQREPLGSKASRSPSPSRLKASVVRSSAIPGQTIRSGREV